jgi:hypothetical protein
VIRDLLRLRALADVFPEVRENRSNLLASQILRGNESILERFSGHEPRDASPHELVVGSMIAQPAVLRSGEQK